MELFQEFRFQTAYSFMLIIKDHIDWYLSIKYILEEISNKSSEIEGISCLKLANETSASHFLPPQLPAFSLQSLLSLYVLLPVCSVLRNSQLKPFFS